MLEQAIENIRETILELAVTDEPVTEETELLLSGILDSMAVTQVVAVMEESLAFEVPPLDMVIENFESMAAMRAYLTRRCANGVH